MRARSVAAAALVAACGATGCSWDWSGLSGGGGGSDGGGGDGEDGGGGDVVDAFIADAVSGCGFARASNVDPCDLPASDGEWVIEEHTTVQTDTTGMGEVGPQADGGTALVIHVDSLQVMAGFSLTFTGPDPVIVISDGDIIVDGTVETQNGADSGLCVPPGAADRVANCGDGGGGGGFAGLGALGGKCQGNADLKEPGQKAGDLSLIPLRGGCRGADGAQGTGGSSPSFAGPAGGGLQLTSASRVRVNGAVLARGHGGRGGEPGAGGGAGGGSGGGLILEAPTVEAGAAGMVCAHGGGGGEGADDGEQGQAGLNYQGTCTSDGGANASSDGAIGGDGGGPSSANGVEGDASAGTFGGGGGGGSAGVIRVRVVNEFEMPPDWRPIPQVD